MTAIYVERTTIDSLHSFAYSFSPNTAWGKQIYEMTEHKPSHPDPWSKGKLIGQKPPLKPQHILGIRIHLQMGSSVRDLALFNFAIDSKLRGGDLVRLRVNDINQSDAVQSRAQIVQQKTH